jgi:ribosome maturation factor RimP
MGRKDDILERVRAVAEPLAGQEGLELIDVQFGGSGRPELTLFIDKLPGGPTSPAPAINMPAASDVDPHQIEASLIAEADRNPPAAVGEDEPDSDEAEQDESDEQDGDAEDPGEDELEEGGELSIEVETPAPGTKPGVTLDDCANFSRIVSAALDVEDPLDGTYELVVSSPGLDRPLRLPAHFQKYAGKRVRVKTYAPVPDAGARKTFVGELLGFDEEKQNVLVDVDGQKFAVPIKAISKANLDPVFDF